MGIESLTPTYGGGLEIYRNLGLNATKSSITTRRGQLYGGWIANLGVVNLYLKFYDALAANVTVGTTTPVITFPMPGMAASSVAAILGAGAQGIEFKTGIVVACTTGLADNDTGNPAANTMVVNFFYCDRIDPRS